MNSGDDIESHNIAESESVPQASKDELSECKDKRTPSLIKNFPYLTKAPNLLDYFLIIGYDTSVINAESEFDIMDEQLDKSDCMQLSERNDANDAEQFDDDDKTRSPSVLNCISSRYCKKMIDEDLIISLVFPKVPPVVRLTHYKKTNSNFNTVIFFFNGDSFDGEDKNVFYGTALVFSEFLQNKKNEIIKIPKAFCVVSQNPFFTLFNNLLTAVYKYFREPSIKIPIEIVLYNLLNFIPAPLNSDYQFNLFTLTQQFSTNEEQSQLPLIESNVDNNNNNTTLLMESQSKKERTIFKFKEINFHADFYLYQLSGYPFIDMNMSEIFKIFPPKTIIIIMILSFLEVDMLFFSKHLSQLNTFMYIISILSYPCTDTTYFWHIVSVSLDDLLYEENNCKFVGKQSSSMLGINASYEDSIDVTESYKYYIVVDIDHNDMVFKCRKDLVEEQEVKNIFDILEYLKELLENVDTKENEKGFLAENVINLYKYLFNIYKSIPKDEKKFGIENVNFFEFDERIYKLNRNMQEVFYKFVLNILDVFHEDCTVKENENFEMQNTNDDNAIQTKHYITYIPNYEKIHTDNINKSFFTLAGSSCKIKLFHNTFLMEHKTIDMYKIPYIFAENFIILRRMGLKSSSIKLLDIIDDFFLSNTITETNNANESIIKFDFAEFSSEYTKSFKQHFHEELKLSPNIRALKTHNKLDYRYSRFDLNNIIIFQYEHLLSNMPSDKINQLFPSLPFLSHPIKMSPYTAIYDSIEYSLIHKIEFEYKELIRFSLLIVISIISEYSDISNVMSLLMPQMEAIKYSIRKYILIIFKIYEHLANKKISDMTIKDTAEVERLNYYLLSNHLTTKKVLPDWELLDYMERFAVLEQMASRKQVHEINEQPQETQKEVKSGGFFSRKEKKLEEADSLSCKLNFKKNAGYLENNVLFDGDLYDNKKVKYVITYSIPKGKRKIDVPVYSPIKLYKECNGIVQQFLEGGCDIEKCDKERLINVMIVLRFYLKNLDEFKDVSCEFFLKYLQVLMMQ